ncbi:MAG: hypothetical protein KA974_00265 [Saprospiraceae bacterium]|nr:hypothetical protein [Saprospiraceae bacterium]MBP7679965.1 hypothetical protein [Saprospiraceae bacterium]
MRYFILPLLSLCLFVISACNTGNTAKAEPPTISINKPAENTTYPLQDSVVGIDILVVAIDDVEIKYVEYEIRNSANEVEFASIQTNPSSTTNDIRVYTEYKKFHPTHTGSFTIRALARDGLNQEGTDEQVFHISQ